MRVVGARNSNAMKFKLLSVYFVTISLSVVRSDGNTTISTSFTGLRGDNNLGHSGYVHVSTDVTQPELELSGCQNIDLNESASQFIHKIPKTESSLLVMQSWVAVTLRDNILALLGYLLDQSDETFSEDADSSLQLVYTEVRKNNLKTMDMVPRLKNIAKLNQISQIIGLFKIIQNFLPVYCKSAVDEIMREFSKPKNPLKIIFSAGITNDTGFDILSDIDPKIVPFLRTSNPLRRSYDKNILVDLGREFTIFFFAIQDGKVTLTQPVLAALMLNMRFDELSPGDNENFRFLTDALRSNKIPDWSPNLIGSVNVKCPYELVEMMMKAISERINIDPTLKEIASQLHTRLQNVSKLSHKKLMDPFFGKAELNISQLLETLENKVKIPEVEIIKSKINDGTLNLSYVLKGFVRYFYDTPDKLISAFVGRIKNRLPMEKEMKEAVEKIASHLQ